MEHTHRTRPKKHHQPLPLPGGAFFWHTESLTGAAQRAWGCAGMDERSMGVEADDPVVRHSAQDAEQGELAA